MYSLTQSKGTTKLLLQSDRQDYGTTDAPTFTLNEVLETPPPSFGLMGLEKVYWRQPSVFPSSHLRTTLYSTGLTGTSTGTGSSTTLIAGKFVPSVTFNGMTQTKSLVDVSYGGSGGEYLARLLECLCVNLNTAL